MQRHHRWSLAANSLSKKGLKSLAEPPNWSHQMQTTEAGSALSRWRGSCTNLPRVRHANCATQLKTRLRSPPSRTPGASAIRRTSAADAGMLTPRHHALGGTTYEPVPRDEPSDGGGRRSCDAPRQAGMHAGGGCPPFYVRWHGAADQKSLNRCVLCALPALHNLGARCRRLSAHPRS